MLIFCCAAQLRISCVNLISYLVPFRKISDPVIVPLVIYDTGSRRRKIHGAQEFRVDISRRDHIDREAQLLSQ